MRNQEEGVEYEYVVKEKNSSKTGEGKEGEQQEGEEGKEGQVG